MKKWFVVPLAALALTACDPDITPEMSTATVTVTETAVETVEITADPVIITRDTSRALTPDTRKWGADGDIQAKYFSYEINAEITDCWQAKEGIYVKTEVTSNVDKVIDASGTIEIMDFDGNSLGRGAVYVPDMFPGDTVPAYTFIAELNEEEFTCRFVLFEAIDSPEYPAENPFLEDN